MSAKEFIYDGDHVTIDADRPGAVNKIMKIIDAHKELRYALTQIAERASYRLRKGPDNGDESTLKLALEALKKSDIK